MGLELRAKQYAVSSALKAAFHTGYDPRYGSVGGNFEKKVETLRATCAVRQKENVATLELFPFLRYLESNKAIILQENFVCTRGSPRKKGSTCSYKNLAKHKTRGSVVLGQVGQERDLEVKSAFSTCRACTE